MNNIPQKSQASLLKGYWFIFKDGDRSIAAGSALTGQEKIFVNDQLVAKKRSFRMISKHHFSWEENAYEVVFRVSLTTGQTECSLAKDGVFVGCFKTSYKSKYTLLVYALVGAVIGFIFGHFNLSLWLLAILFPIAIMLAIATQNNNIVINPEV